MAISNKTVLVLLRKLLLVLLAACLCFGVIAVAIVGGEPTFDDTYQSVIQRKYQKLITAEGPKIVIIGGSNAGFGFDTQYLTEQAGRPVINMGLHAGFGQLFNTEIARDHIHEGDVVILAYEYGLTASAFDYLGDLDVIMKGLDNNLKMYTKIPLKNMPEVFGNLISHAKNKAYKTEQATGTYSSASFDEEGNMILQRDTYTIADYENNISTYGRIYGNSMIEPDEQFEYLQELKAEVEAKGASIYFTAPVMLAAAYEGTEQQMLDYAAEMERRTGITYISNPNEYLMPEECIFDTIYHCTSLGQQIRTETFLKDLRAYGIVR